MAEIISVSATASLLCLRLAGQSTADPPTGEMQDMTCSAGFADADVSILR